MGGSDADGGAAERRVGPIGREPAEAKMGTPRDRSIMQLAVVDPNPRPSAFPPSQRSERAAPTIVRWQWQRQRTADGGQSVALIPLR